MKPKVENIFCRYVCNAELLELLELKGYEVTIVTLVTHRGWGKRKNVPKTKKRVKNAKKRRRPTLHNHRNYRNLVTFLGKNKKKTTSTKYIFETVGNVENHCFKLLDLMEKMSVERFLDCLVRTYFDTFRKPLSLADADVWFGKLKEQGKVFEQPAGTVRLLK